MACDVFILYVALIGDSIKNRLCSLK